MVPRIDPALPLVWRSPVELQLGGLAPRVVIRDPGALETGIISALRHGASRSTLHTIGAGLDGSPAEVERVLELIAPAFDDATDVPRPSPDRPSGRVVVDADGEVARLLLANLAALGHDAVGFVDVDADDPLEDVALVVIASAWVVPPSRHLPWLRRDVPHLTIVDDERGVTVGPLVEPGRGPCLRCIELDRRDADPAWPAIAAQLAGRPGPHPGYRSAFDAAAMAASAVDDHLRFGRSALAATSLTLVAGAPPSPARHRPHPECGCRAPAGTVTARARHDAHRPGVPSSVRADAVPA
jgi:hypothetical protein